MEKDLISIVIPIYNVEKYLCRCVDSIINQTYKNIEIILVDDESPDNCPAICDRYAEKDERIKVIHKKNGGLSDARNSGIDIATGQYIMFIDSDDFVKEDMLEKMYDTIVNDNTDMVLCNYEFVDENSMKLNRDRRAIFNENEKHIIISENDFWENYNNCNRIYYVVSWNKLYAGHIFKNIRYPKGRINEDEYVLHKIVNRCKNISCICDKLYFYVQRSDSIMAKNTGIKSVMILDALDKRISYFVRQKKYWFVDTAFTMGLEYLKQYKKNNKHIGKEESNIFKHYYKKWKKEAVRILFMKNQSFKVRTKMLIFYFGGIRVHNIFVGLYNLCLPLRKEEDNQ